MNPDYDYYPAPVTHPDPQECKSAASAKRKPMPEDGGAATEEWLRSQEPARAATPAPIAPADPLALLERFFVTDDQVKQMAETRMIWRDIIASSHLCAWIAPPNGGKTSVAKMAAGELARTHTVLFFQEDAPAGDLPAHHDHAKEHGYRLLNSTLANSRPEDQIEVLEALVQSAAPLDRYIMFFDTLKKFLDLMSKGGAKQFFQLMRSLTQRGATVILLGHTNKHRGVDGKMIFEGVGDVRADVDELIYIHATDKDAAGIVMLTMRPDKVRCMVKETTFELDTRTMSLRALDRVVDVAAVMEAKRQREEDGPVIECIRSALAAGGLNYTTLLDMAIAASGESRRTVKTVLDRYLATDPASPDALWLETRINLNNTRYISLKLASEGA